MSRWRPTPRQGVSAQRVVLRGHVPADGVEYWAAGAGDSPFPPGTLLEPLTALDVPTPAWFHPQVHEEPDYLLNLDIPVLYESRDVLVVDKPHGLPSTPNGSLMRANAQTMLRVHRSEMDLVAAHRLDRLTGGVLLLSRRPDTRGFLQTQFLRRTVAKTYVGRSAVRVAGFEQETVVELPMLKIKDVPQVRVDPAGKLTRTRVRLLGRTEAGEWEYLLRPETGHTHQLRVLMNHLGAPLVGDSTYPMYRPTDFSNEALRTEPRLGLRAVSLTFRDPAVGGRAVEITQK
ncbi:MULTISPECIES: pseudouridine synthase [Corynebacterium]|uniref:pseudouridine synthase n=1 Tax=Corynebacterium TaxID=1716 RepID=UPI001E46CB76|nr:MULTISPECIES: pseudouridine synthase [Corynebacterium]